MPDRLHETIARQMKEAILSDRSFQLSSILDLAGRWNVAYLTMWKAVRVLVAEGILTASRGRKLSLGPNAGARIAHQTRTSADDLYETVKQRIEDGIYRVGRQFPKTGFFVVTEGVSPNTVARTFHRLRRERLAYQRRRRWFVGPAQRRSSPSVVSVGRAGQEAPVILVLGYEPYDWQASFTDSFTTAFTHPFRNELMDHGVLLSPVLAKEAADPAFTAPAGVGKVRSLIASLGDRYQGTFVSLVWPHEARLATWIEALAAFGKPVVFFDSADKGVTLARKDRHVRRAFVRMHLDECSAIRTSLARLARLGHTTVAVHGATSFDWCARRTERITALAQELSPQIRIVTGEPAEDCWHFGENRELHAVVTDVARRMPSASGDQEPVTRGPAFRSLLLDNTRSLANLLRDHRPTAILALNDLMAREYYFWFQALGIRVPQDMSLLSFDNTPESMYFPISTLDFGFARLGYLAAHTFIGDLSITPGRDGSIPGECTLIDRGSIGRPRKDDRSLRILRSGARR